MFMSYRRSRRNQQQLTEEAPLYADYLRPTRTGPGLIWDGCSDSRAAPCPYTPHTPPRRGELLGGDEGHALLEQANLWMANQGIKNPLRITAMLAPGQ
jgi:hypothetical protein